MQYFFGEHSADLLNYHATINTGPLAPTAVASLLAAQVERTADGQDHCATVPAATTPSQPRVLTLTSQLGSRETDLARELGRRLNIQVWDRETLAKETGLARRKDSPGSSIRISTPGATARACCSNLRGGQRKNDILSHSMPIGQYVPQWMGTATRGSTEGNERAARYGSK